MSVAPRLIQAAFISDIHLHPEELEITERFYAFIEWAAKNTEQVYILGDFLHVWPGDDALDPWSQGIVDRLSWLSQQGVQIYFMPGNRDFLLGDRFMQLSGMRRLNEPAVIQLGQEKFLLAHGDQYCTNDRAHQWLRRLTRNQYFPRIFLKLPYSLRNRCVSGLRKHSQNNRKKTANTLSLNLPDMLNDMHNQQVTKIIHGHTHQYGIYNHQHNQQPYQEYILSDWDHAPYILCYNRAGLIEFMHFSLISRE